VSVYRDGAPGITTRGPGEPCQHPHRVSYTDEGGVYARCQVCRAQFLNGHPIGAGTTAAAGSDPLVLDHQLELPFTNESRDQ